MDEKTSRAKGEPTGPRERDRRGGERERGQQTGHKDERPTKHLDYLLAALGSVGAGGGTGTVGAISGGCSGDVVSALLGGDGAVVGGRGCTVVVQVSAGTHAVTGGIDVHRIPSVQMLMFWRWMVAGLGSSEGRGGHARQR